MNQDKLNEHILKEALKKTVDNSPNYSDKVKTDLKGIIDAGRSPQEILEATLIYFSALRFY